MNAVQTLLASLRSNDVSFVVVGGVAAILHGSSRVTYDVDVVYDRSPENLRRIVAALAPFDPYLRGAPPGLPFRFDVETLQRGLNFTLTTTQGAIDLLGELLGVGSFSDVCSQAVEAELPGGRYLFIDLDTLIVSKKAAGRAKDLEAVAELELIREQRQR
jgi:predicted nucleotidyltransferase